MDSTDRIMRLFEGYDMAYGTHGAMSQNDTKGGKQEIKKTARTVAGRVTREIWESHLSGDNPLGVIPIRSDNTCLWGCIDVDKYDMHLGEVVKKIESSKFPLVVCRTKSGGAHLFLFLTEPAPAEQVRIRLREMAASMGWGDCEVFPKQSRVMTDRGDLGNWLNMPYLGGDETTRYGVKESGSGMVLSEFLSWAESRRVSPSSLGRVRIPQPEDETLDDGPPCLQHLASVGFPEGTRNNGLFGLGVFCKRKFGSRWREMLEKYNREYMRPPLSSEEVMSTIKNLDRQEYGYKCSDQPCVSYCNSTLCRTRKFGIGSSSDYPSISGLSKLDSDPAIWFMDIDDERIELTTRQLQSYREFHTVCMERLTICYKMLKQDTWMDMVRLAMEGASIIELPPEAKNEGHFRELLEDFCVNRHAAQARDEIFDGKPFHDEEDGNIYFKLSSLMDFLDRHNFKVWGRNKVSHAVLTIGGKKFLNIRGKGVNVFWVRALEFVAVPQRSVPATQEEPV